MHSGYTPVAGIPGLEIAVLTNDDLVLMAVAWLRQLASESSVVERQHARRVIVSLARKFRDEQLGQFIDATPPTEEWDEFVRALEAEIERRVVATMEWQPGDPERRRLWAQQPLGPLGQV